VELLDIASDDLCRAVVPMLTVAFRWLVLVHLYRMRMRSTRLDEVFEAVSITSSYTPNRRSFGID
jgi:hypothetical protein